MKRLLSVSILSLCFMLSRAQNTEWGVKGGVNISTMSYENTTNPDTRLSWNLGVLAHIHLTDLFAVQPELIYSGQGAKGTISDKTYTLALNYVTLPVLGQIMAGQGWRVETGPQFGVRTSASAKQDGNSSDIGDGFKTFDIGWVFGAGYLTHFGFALDVRYIQGFSNINDGSETIHNRVLSLGISYQFERVRRY